MEPSVATVTTINAPIAQTRAFVEYHLRAGIDHMFLYFDDPQDPSIPKLQTGRRVTCVRCDEDHWRDREIAPDAPIQTKQMSNATEAFRRASEDEIEWLVHIDSDELLHAPTSLKELFAASPERADVLVFPTKEAVPQQFQYDRPFWDITLFKYDPSRHLLRGTLFGSAFERRARGMLARSWRYRKWFATKMSWLHPTGLDSFLLGHTNGKAAARTSVPVQKIGNHRPHVDDYRRLGVYPLRRGAVLHFDCRGYESWRRKWMRRVDGTSHFNTERFRADRKRILQMFQRATQVGEKALERLYRCLYMLSSKQRLLLRSLGLVERISLPREDSAFLDHQTEGSDGRPSIPVNVR
jgi:hypothetical protein